MPSAIREFPRLDLHYEAETPTGRFYRWGKDEPRAENVPSGAGFSTTDHGGFDSQNLVLPRKPGRDAPDLERLTTIRALGAGGEVACETRLKEAPRTSGDQIAVSPVAEGWIAHLEDDQTAAEIYQDRDLSGWSEPSAAKRNGLTANQYNTDGQVSVAVGAATGTPAIVHAFAHINNHATANPDICESEYVAGPIQLGQVILDGVNVVGLGTGWNQQVWANESDETYGNLLYNFSGTTQTAISLTIAALRYALSIQTYFPGAFEGEGKWEAQYRNISVIGRHGLTRQGSGAEAGFLTSDIIADALSRWAPLLNISTGSTGSIRPGSFVVPHLSFKEQTTPLAILEAVNRFELRPYYVWENRTFYWQEWGEGRKWRARVAPTQLSETGPSTARLRNGVLLKWSDVDGTSRSAGPTGSGSDIESAELEDRDPENPANQIGARMWGTPYDLGIVTVDSEAIRIGTLLLARLKEVDRSGQAQIVGVCEDDKGVLRPYWQVRAGDTITFIDAADTSERRIIATQADDDAKTNTITLDAPPDSNEDLLAQLGVSNTALGL